MPFTQDIPTKTKIALLKDFEAGELPTCNQITTLTIGKKCIQQGALIGKGGEAEVYSGIDISSDKKYAIKKFSDQSMSYIESLRSEELGLKRLGRFHGKLNVYSENESSQTTYLAMDYYDGQNLENFLYYKDDIKFVKRKITFHQKVELCLSIIQATLELHERNLLHRDIKPANFIIMSDKTSLKAKLVDLGSSIPYDEIKQSKNTIGSHGYKAPEIPLRDPFRADLYSLGIVLAEVMSHENYKHKIKILLNLLQTHTKEQHLKRSTIRELAKSRDSATEIKKYIQNQITHSFQEPEIPANIIKHLMHDILRNRSDGIANEEIIPLFSDVELDEQGGKPQGLPFFDSLQTAANQKQNDSDLKLLIHNIENIEYKENTLRNAEIGIKKYINNLIKELLCFTISIDQTNSLINIKNHLDRLHDKYFHFVKLKQELSPVTSSRMQPSSPTLYKKNSRSRSTPSAFLEQPISASEPNDSRNSQNTSINGEPSSPLSPRNILPTLRSLIRDKRRSTLGTSQSNLLSGLPSSSPTAVIHSPLSSSINTPFHSPAYYQPTDINFDNLSISPCMTTHFSQNKDQRPKSKSVIIMCKESAHKRKTPK